MDVREAPEAIVDHSDKCTKRLKEERVVRWPVSNRKLSPKAEKTAPSARPNHFRMRFRLTTSVNTDLLRLTRS